MRFLVDTHFWLWMGSHSRRLSRHAAELLSAAESELVVSIASPWEATIKASLGKFTLARPIDQLMRDAVTIDRIALLPIEPAHLVELRSLPLHHRDPFDRLIIAQALAEKLPVLTDDRAFARYEVALIDPADGIP